MKTVTARYNGICKLSGKEIKAGVSELVKHKGQWVLFDAVPPKQRRVMERQTATYKGYTYTTARFQGNYNQHGIIQIDRPDGTSIMADTMAINKHNGRYNTITEQKNDPHGSCAKTARFYIDEDIAALAGIMTETSMNKLHSLLHNFMLEGPTGEALVYWYENEYSPDGCTCHNCQAHPRLAQARIAELKEQGAI